MIVVVPRTRCVKAAVVWYTVPLRERLAVVSDECIFLYQESHFTNIFLGAARSRFTDQFLRTSTGLTPPPPLSEPVTLFIY